MVGTFGHVVIASMAAFVLAKYEFPGGRLFFMLATTFLMFASGVVTAACRIRKPYMLLPSSYASCKCGERDVCEGVPQPPPSTRPQSPSRR